MSFNDLLNQILSNNPTVARDQLITMVEQKKQESHGLLSDEGAIRLVAQQLSVSPLSSTGFADQRIASVHAGLNNSTITGQVIMAGEIRGFQRSDGTQGKVLRMKVGDPSGQITCVFWDDMADAVAREGLTPDSQVRLLHGYTKNGMGGEVEFHLGSRASFQILKRSQSLIAKFWDNHAQGVLSLGEGSLVLIQNQWITERNGMVYVNVGSKSSINKESMDLVAETPVTSIGSLRPGPVLWTISGNVVERSEVREIETREGRRTRVSNINVEDEPKNRR